MDTVAGTLQIDFAVHGEHGIAGVRALTAKPGDKLCFSGPGGMYAQRDDEGIAALPHNERGVDRKGLSLSAYWAYGRAEDEFQAGDVQW